MKFTGNAGQGWRGWQGVSFELMGDANDYVARAFPVDVSQFIRPRTARWFQKRISLLAIRSTEQLRVNAISGALRENVSQSEIRVPLPSSKGVATMVAST